MLIKFPTKKKRHARASKTESGAPRATSAIILSAVSPAALASSVPSTKDHHSSGILSLCHHLETADGFAPMAPAMPSRDGQSSMIERNEIGSDMPDRMGQFVPSVKAIMSRDDGKLGGHTVLMRDDEFDLADKEFRARFQSRLRDIQGKRTDDAMAELLAVPTERYKKWKNRDGSQFPMFLLPRLANIAAEPIAYLITGQRPPEKKKSTPKKRAKSA